MMKRLFFLGVLCMGALLGCSEDGSPAKGAASGLSAIAESQDSRVPEEVLERSQVVAEPVEVIKPTVSISLEGKTRKHEFIYSVAVTNTSGTTVERLSGSLEFHDASGRVLKVLALSFNRKLDVGQSLTFDGVLTAADINLPAKAKFPSLSAKWAPQDHVVQPAKEDSQ